ncbi:MAG: universal stress protein [Dehalococcoidia bacterium]|nr:universal stress protein [Dehalococcoidia bacterium]
MFNKIIAPLDESDLSEQALSYAKEIGKQFKSELVLLQAVTAVAITMTDLGSGMESPTATAMSIESARSIGAANFKAATDYLDAKVKQVSSEGVRASSKVILDTPAKAILDVCKTENIELIVMTPHGRSGLGRAIIGSVADQVI